MKKALAISIYLFYAPLAFTRGDNVVLTYKWEPGIEATISYIFKHTKTRDGKNTERTISGTQKMTTSEHQDGLRLDFTVLDNEVNAENQDKQENLQKFLEKVSEISPSYIISDEGKIAYVIGLKELHEQITSELDNSFKAVDHQKVEKVREIISRMLSEEGIMAIITRSWNRDVGQWIGAEFTKGKGYKVEFLTPVPVLGNAQVKTIGEYRYLGKVNCNQEDKSKQCARLVFKSSMDEKSIKKAVIEMMKKMGKTIPETFMLQTDYEVEIITEYETLLPHSIMENKTVTISGIKGEPPAIQTDHKEFTYVYNNRP